VLAKNLDYSPRNARQFSYVSNTDPTLLVGANVKAFDPWVQTDDDVTPTTILGKFIRDAANAAWIEDTSGGGGGGAGVATSASSGTVKVNTDDGGGDPVVYRVSEIDTLLAAAAASLAAEAATRAADDATETAARIAGDTALEARVEVVEDTDVEQEARIDALEAALGDASGVASGTFLQSFGGITYDSGLTFIVGPCIYYINFVKFTTPGGSVTLDAADPSDPRIDLIALDSTGPIKITGTPGATPAAPVADPSTQVALSAVNVAAGATSITVTTTYIYQENTEWTFSTNAGGVFNANSTNNPRSGSKDIEATTAVATNRFELTKPASGTEDLSLLNNLVFPIRSKASWPTKKSLRLTWYRSGSPVGSSFTIKQGSLGFDSSVTASYQVLSIPMINFGVPIGQLVDTLRVEVVGAGSSIGFYVDDIAFQSSAEVGGGTPPGGVTSFNGRTGAVIPTSGDYSASQISGLGSLATVTPTGSPDGTKFLRDDNSWQNPPGAVSDTAYDATSWDGVTSVAPSKNAVRDKIESILDGQAFTGAITVPDDAYDATSWNGNTEVPTKNAIRDKIESLSTASVSDVAYDATTWDGVTTVAPSKNAVRDKIEAILAGVTFTGAVVVPADAYDATTWNGSNQVPTKDAVRDKIESILDGQAFTGAITVPDDAYDATTWNGSTEVPTKNAVRDKIESILVGGVVSDTAYDATTWDGVTTIAPSKNAVRDKIEAILAGVTFTGAVVVPADAYDATTWNGSNQVPTKDAVRDKIEAILAGVTFTGAVTVPADAYDATTWNGSNVVPTKDAVRDKIESILDGQTFTGDVVVPDDAYDATTWNGNNAVPTKNAVRDKIESLSSSSGVPPIDLLAASSIQPDILGDISFSVLSAFLTTNKTWPIGVWVLGVDNTVQPSVRSSVYNIKRIPAGYTAASAVVKIGWTSTKTSGNAVLSFQYRKISGNDSDSLDQTGTTETVQATVAAPTASGRDMETSLTLTAANFAAGDRIQFLVGRLGADAADTIAGSVLMHSATLVLT